MALVKKRTLMYLDQEWRVHLDKREEITVMIL